MSSSPQVTVGPSRGTARFEVAVRSAALRLVPQWREPEPTPAAQPSRVRSVARRVVQATFRRSWPTVAPVASRGRDYLDRPTQESLRKLHREVSTLSSLLAELTTQFDTHRCEVWAVERDHDSRLRAITEVASAAATRQAIPLSGGRLLVRTSLGYVTCDDSDPGTILMLFEGDGWEPGTRRVLERLLSPGDTYVDVGANVGIHVLAASAAVGPRGLVVAIEPFPRTYELLIETVWLGGYRTRVEAHRCAVADAPGQSELFLGPSSGEHSLIAHAHGGESVAVPLRTLDDIVGDRPVTVVKIDAEGGELGVLRGASKLLAANPGLALVVEFAPSHLEVAGESTAGWLGAFEAHGLVFAAVDEVTGEVGAIGVEELESRYSVNLVFAAADSDVWTRLSTTPPEPVTVPGPPPAAAHPSVA
ncbi:MAG: FkbM family methyltransferase [Dermatophilaceae bacterium]